MKTLLVDEWHTIDLPDKRVGCAEIVTSHYKKGVYLMEKVGGYDLFEVKKKIPVHSLKINDETVMVDDPLHWIGMKLIAEASFGRVFVAGLGLGLIVHHLVKNPKVTKIVVYEINSDVIALIGPHLPDDKRIEIVQGDALRHAEEKFDTYIFDLWVKRGKENSKNMPSVRDVMLPVLRIQLHRPYAKVFVWGSRSIAYNPAVKPMTEDYEALIEAIEWRE